MTERPPILVIPAHTPKSKPPYYRIFCLIVAIFAMAMTMSCAPSKWDTLGKHGEQKLFGML